MTPMDETDDHHRLSQRAARIRSVDLAAATREGILTHAEYAEALALCRTCSDPDACRKWLAAAEAAATVEDGADMAAIPPAYCRNAALFEELRRL